MNRRRAVERGAGGAALPERVRIGSRGSRLALVQAEWVRDRVAAHHPHLTVEIDVFRCRYRGGEVVLDGPTDYRWITLEETDRYAFPKANHKFLPEVRRALAAPGPRGNSPKRRARLDSRGQLD